MKAKLIFLLYLNSILVYSQKVQLIDLKNNTISDAAVYGNISKSSTISNNDGIIFLNNFVNDDLLSISHISYNEYVVLKKHIKDTVILEARSFLLQPLEITAPKNNFYINSYTSIEQKSLSKISAGQSTDLLQKGLGVSIQHSQNGAGSPNIRGMEASRLLIVVDDIVLNNTISRSGRSQILSNIDPLCIKNIQILSGPSSVSFGDGAMGSSIVINTINPSFFKKQKFFLKQEFHGSSNSVLTNYLYSNKIKKLSFLTNLSIKSFGNLKMGQVRNHGFKNWGKEKHVTNGNEQLFTGYNQFNVLHKNMLKLSGEGYIQTSTQYSLTGKLNRYDKLNDISDNNPKYRQWYYGPSRRVLQSVKLKKKYSTILFNQNETSFAFQNITESRNKQKLNDSLLSIRKENLDVYDINSDFIKNLKFFDLNYGINFRYQNLNSSAYLKDSLNNKFYNTTRYPDGGSEVQNISVYSQLNCNIIGSLFLYLGTRLNSNKINAQFIDNTTINLPYSIIEAKNITLTSSLMAKYKLARFFDLTASLYSGYRNPNVDDFGKIFSKNDNEVIIPNNNLEPEKANNTEFSINFQKGKNKISILVFNSKIYNAIIRSVSTLNGLDSIYYDGKLMKVLMNKNIKSAEIRGVDIYFSIELLKGLLFKNSFHYVKGEGFDGSPLSHIPPLKLNNSLEYSYNKNTYSLSSIYSARKKASDFDFLGVDNLDEATEIGTPSWFILNFFYSKELDDQLLVSIGVENIFDLHYKTFASGLSSSGRNLILSLQYKM